MDRWWHHGFCHEEASDTAVFVPVTHEHCSFQGAALQPTVSWDLVPTTCPMPSGCKGEEKMKNSRLEITEGLSGGLGFFFGHTVRRAGS